MTPIFMQMKQTLGCFLHPHHSTSMNAQCHKLWAFEMCLTSRSLTEIEDHATSVPMKGAKSIHVNATHMAVEENEWQHANLF